MLSDREHKLSRWQEYYDGLLNRPPATISADLLAAAASAQEDSSISIAPPNVEELSAAVSKLKNGKASGVCNIAAEMLKCGGPETIIWLTNIIRQAWESEVLLGDWRKGIILPFYKGKGSRQECKNYRGITLLSVPGKVFAQSQGDAEVATMPHDQLNRKQP